VSWAAHELESYVIQKHMKARVHVSYLAILLGCYVPDLVTKWVVFGVSIGPIDMPAPKDPWKYHRGWPGAGLTHSLTFGFLVAFFVLWKFRSREWFLGLLVGTAAHVLTDAFDSVGTMLFFPFTTQHYTTGMWAYAAQQGANGDGAAYYSGPGGAWDLLWLVIALFNWRVLTRKYFWDSVVPDDPAWGWVQRKLRLSDATLLALYRAYFLLRRVPHLRLVLLGTVDREGATRSFVGRPRLGQQGAGLRLRPAELHPEYRRGRGGPVGVHGPVVALAGTPVVGSRPTSRSGHQQCGARVA
jgi:membrane-bound metal-dependent hydrolase YbcI (DUF457 family)